MNPAWIISDSQKQSIKGLRAKSAQQRNGYGTGVNNSGQPGYGYNGPKSAEDAFTQQIFGHNIFDNEYLTFEPNINVATPDNYRLGAGDEVIIDVWGASQTTIRGKNLAGGYCANRKVRTGLSEWKDRRGSQ